MMNSPEPFRKEPKAQRLNRYFRHGVGAGIAVVVGWLNCWLVTCLGFTVESYIGPAESARRAAWAFIILGQILSAPILMGWVCALVWKRESFPSNEQGNGLGCAINLLVLLPFAGVTWGAALLALPVQWLLFWWAATHANRFLARPRWREWLDLSPPEVTQRTPKDE